MGFGPLLIAYILLLNPGVYDAFSGFIAYLLILYGMISLRVYNKELRYAFIAASVLAVFGAVRFGFFGYAFLGFGDMPPVSATVFAIGAKALTLVFTWLLFGGVREIAKEVRLPEIASASTRNRVFFAIYSVAAISLEVTGITPELSYAAVHAVIPVMLCGFVVIGLSAWTLYRCFRDIGLPDA